MVRMLAAHIGESSFRLSVITSYGGGGGGAVETTSLCARSIFESPGGQEKDGLFAALCLIATMAPWGKALELKITMASIQAKDCGLKSLGKPSPPKPSHHGPEHQVWKVTGH